MTARHMCAWLALMKATRGWSLTRSAAELGCTRATLKRWMQTGAPIYIGLACAALAFGLPAWAMPEFTAA